jgi:hypothetical protein
MNLHSVKEAGASASKKNRDPAIAEEPKEKVLSILRILRPSTLIE